MQATAQAPDDTVALSGERGGGGKRTHTLAAGDGSDSEFAGAQEGCLPANAGGRRVELVEPVT